MTDTSTFRRPSHSSTGHHHDFPLYESSFFNRNRAIRWSNITRIDSFSAPKGVSRWVHAHEWAVWGIRSISVGSSASEVRLICVTIMLRRFFECNTANSLGQSSAADTSTIAKEERESVKAPPFHWTLVIVTSILTNGGR